MCWALSNVLNFLTGGTDVLTGRLRRNMVDHVPSLNITMSTKRKMLVDLQTSSRPISRSKTADQSLIKQLRGK